jgi:hypothetical protein
MIWLHTPQQDATPITAASDGFAVLVNEKFITTVWPHLGGSLVCTVDDDDGFNVIETPEDIEGIIGAAS